MENLDRHFGLVIAYLLPGFVALAGLAPLSPTLAGWLGSGGPGQPPGLGAPLYVLLAATAAGMVVGCLRWLLVDRLHALTGVGAAAFNAKALEEKPAAFHYLVEQHYRYYQFYANTLVAAAGAYLAHRLLGTSPFFGAGTDLAAAALGAVLFAGSRDALSKYRDRVRQLAGRYAKSSPEGTTPFEGEVMTNGIDHHQGGTSPKPPTQKPATQNEKGASPKTPDAKAAPPAGGAK